MWSGEIKHYARAERGGAEKELRCSASLRFSRFYVGWLDAMKNFPRILFGGVTIASALLCAGAVALWVHDRSNPSWYKDEIGFSTARSHYTISSRDGHLRLTGPPKATPADLSEKAWDALRKLNNLDIDWAQGEPRKGTPAAKLEELGSPVLPLLRGLDSPRKFGAAAVLLERAGNLVTWLHPPNGLVGSAEDLISAYGVVLDGNRPKDDPDSFPFVVMPGYHPDFRCRVDQHMHSSKRSEFHERV